MVPVTVLTEPAADQLAGVAGVFDQYRRHYGQPVVAGQTLAWLTEQTSHRRLAVDWGGTALTDPACDFGLLYRDRFANTKGLWRVRTGRSGRGGRAGDRRAARPTCGDLGDQRRRRTIDRAGPQPAGRSAADGTAAAGRFALAQASLAVPRACCRFIES
jgi:hypothetical protein